MSSRDRDEPARLALVRARLQGDRLPDREVAAKLAVGYTLDEIPNDLTRTTPASFEPTLDYVVVKFPRFAFEKFPGADPTLGTQMKSVGEAMGIGRTFTEAFSRRLARASSTPAPRPPGRRSTTSRRAAPVVRRAARGRASAQLAHGRHPAGEAGRLGRRLDRRRLGHSRRRRARARYARGIRPSYRRVDSCAGEVEAASNYFYSTWGEEDEELPARDAPRVVILGSGPNRIGQGIEFDYCCVHAVQTFRSLGYEAMMVNCNPETVSTDYDTSDRLYFEPLSRRRCSRSSTASSRSAW